MKWKELWKSFCDSFWDIFSDEPPCPDSKDGKHDWDLSHLEKGIGLSRIQVCKHCGKQQVNL